MRPWGASRRPTAGKWMSAAEGEVDGGGPALVDLDLTFLLAELLVPGLDRVLTGRHVGDREGPVGTGDREVRVIEHADVAVHPGMDVALHRDHHLGAVELGLLLLDELRHREVELGVLL